MSGAGEDVKVTVKAKMKLLKFDEGAEEPFEVVEREVELTGDQAKALLQGGNVDAIN